MASETKTTDILQSKPSDDGTSVDGDAVPTPPSDAPSIDDDAPLGSRSEVKALEERYTKKGDVEVLEKDQVPKSAQHDSFAAYALVSKQDFDVKHKLQKTTLQINSPQLLQVLKEVVTYYPSNPLDFDTPFSIEAPFHMFYHHRQEFAQYTADTTDETTKAHLQLFLDYLNTQWGKMKTEAEKLNGAGLVTFSLLWTIFKPGELVYQAEHGHERVFRFQDASYEEHKENGLYFKVICTYTSYDGEHVGKAKQTLEIFQKREFAGTSASDIKSLSIFPFKYYEEQDELKKRLIKRGERFLEMRGIQEYYYSGLFLYLKTPPEDHYSECDNMAGVWLPRTGSGRIILDCKTFSEESDAQRVSIQRYDASNVSNQQNGTSLDGSAVDPMLCPPFAFGFSLAAKTWSKFFVDFLEPIHWQPKPLESLVLPDHQKQVIRALVTAHRFPDQARDEASLKGNGLVMLLHGAPGCGKTLTAEIVAEHTKRPLLIFSAGELGSWEHQIHAELKRLLGYASIWKAIVLIDEADVFLEARTSGSTYQLEQNALVAVFLRQLEFFQGIVFLTSNRIATFDAAIKSRIHLALQYELPDRDTRRRLWRQRLAKVPATEKDLGDIEATLDFVAKPEMNGREISNTVGTASTLARDEGAKLQLGHLKVILRVWTEFEATVKKIERSAAAEKVER